jgi:hypothetical protein
MNSAVVVSVLAMIVFLVMASGQMFALVKSMGVKDVEMSLIVRSLFVGVLTYLLYSLLL